MWRAKAQGDWMRTKRKNGESVSPVIATILMVAITVVLAAVLYVLVSSFLIGTDREKNIGVACSRVGQTNYRCSVVSADTGTDFVTVGIQVTTSNGSIVASWGRGIDLSAGGSKENDSALPPIASGRVVDNGDGAFGTGDDVYLSPISGGSLGGLSIKLSGTRCVGAASIG